MYIYTKGSIDDEDVTKTRARLQLLSAADPWWYRGSTGAPRRRIKQNEWKKKYAKEEEEEAKKKFNRGNASSIKLAVRI